MNSGKTETITDIDQLIGKCLDNDRKAQNMLYREFYGYSMSICYRYANNYDDAVEILNEAFLKIFNNLEKFDRTKSFKAWLRQILINTSINHYKRYLKHQAQQPLEYAVHERTEEKISGQIGYEEIMALVKNLSPAYRAVFNLYAIDGYKHEEIAEMLDISVGTSKSNLSKAKRNLQEMLKKEYNYELV